MRNGQAVAEFERACRKCGRSRSECAADRASKARARAKAYRLANTSKVAAANKAYREQQRGRIAEQRRNYRVANREAIRAQKAADYALNREAERSKRKARYNSAAAVERSARWARKNPGRKKAQQRVYRQRHPDKILAKTERKRARTMAAAGAGVTAADWEAIVAASLGICSYCNSQCRPTMDHIEPIALGGEHDPENIAPACNRCNASKGNKRLLLWLATKKAA